MESQPPHIVIAPTPGMGHLVPLVELAKRMIRTNHFTFSFLISSWGPPNATQMSILESLPKDQADYYFLPPVNLDDLGATTKIETRLALTLTRSLPAIRAHLTRELHQPSPRRITTLVVDLFGTDAFDVAFEFGVKPYLFFTSSAMCLSLMVHLRELDTQVPCEFRDMEEHVQLPGCVPVHGKDLLYPLQDRKSADYACMLHHAERYKLAKGILVNSFHALEEGALQALERPELVLPPIYTIGPLVQTGLSSCEGSEYLKWLDEQPHGSVIFVSFGSAWTLDHDQLTEIAHGLEMSEQRFLWVVRSPAPLLHVNHKNPLDYLPEGFLARTKDRGMVIPSWASQIDVLSHPSTGAFLTHCGWNSILESVVHGVPLIAWPLFAEQHMNAPIVTEYLKVALRPKANENGLIGREEITMVAKNIMEGEEGKNICRRMNDLKDAACRVLSVHGSSTAALSEVALKWETGNLGN